MATDAWRFRASILVLVGALHVHQLRYALADLHADEAAHVYMSWLGPLVCGSLVLAVAEFGWRLIGRARSRDPKPVPGVRVRWLGLAGLLIAIFATQEIGETLVAHGRLDLAESLVTHGAWLAGPLSLALGGLIALLLRGAHALLRHAGGVLRLAAVRARDARIPDLSGLGPAPAVLACNLAGRGPPPPLVVA